MTKTHFDDHYFTSDLHIGHDLAAELRGFSSIAEHDDCIFTNLMESIPNKRAKVWFVGDICFNKKSLERFGQLRLRNKALILGNHDEFKMKDYLTVFQSVHGFMKWKNFWLGHCPIHPQELYRVRGQIHGHIHKDAATKPLPLPYFNVNVDFWDFKPVPFSTIEKAFTERDKKPSTMDIYSPPGTKIVFSNPGAGFKPDIIKAGKYLSVDSIYTVEKTVVHDWHTEVFLVEVPGIAFNSVQFTEVKDD